MISKRGKNPLIIKVQYRILFIAAISLLLITAGYVYYQDSSERIRNEGIKDLTTISKLKTNQIVKWHNEREADAKVIFGDPYLISLAESLLKDKKNPEIKNKCTKILNLFRQSFEYESVFLTSVNADVLSSVGLHISGLDEVTKQKITQAVKDKKIEDTDFYFCETENKIHYDIIAPLKDNEDRVIAILVLRTNPYDYLYPLIQSWPTPSKTAETLLIRKKGKKVLFLNNLKYQKNAALKLEIPLTEKDVPAVQAVLGYKGIWNGKDYRGVEVLSYINSIPGTNWFMIAKIDDEEIFSELKYRESIIITLLILLITSTAIGISWFYHFRQRNIYRQLYETQEGFKTTLYSIGDGVITTDNNGIVQHLNKIAEELTGWTEKEAIGKKLDKVFNIISEDTRNRVENSVRMVLAEGVIVGLANHTLLISKSGKEIPIADSGAPIKDDTGEIVGVVLVFRDQTEERKTRKLITDSETKYRRLFESAKDGIIILDAESGKIVDVNPFLIGLLGYSHDTFLGKSIWEIGLFKDVVANHDKFLELQGQGYVRYGDLPLKTADGQKIIVEFVSNVYLVNSHKVIQCNIRDVTERKTTEKALGESQQIIKGIINTIPVRVFWKDKNLIYLGCNKNFAQDAGFTDPDEIVGKDDYQMGWGSQAELYRNDDFSVIKSGVPKVNIEEPQNTPDGKVITLLTSKIPLRNDNGEIIGVLGTYIDITERKRIEQSVQESEKFLKETQKIAKLGSYTLDIATGKWESSEILDLIFGIEPDFDKTIEGWASIIHPDMQNSMNEYFTNEVIGLKKQFNKEYRIIRQSDKSERWVHGMGELVFNEEKQPVKMIGTIRDITESKIIEQEILRLNRVYSLLSNTNQAIVRVQDQQKLFDEICRIAINNGKFRMAWIGLVNEDTNKVEVAASAGFIENYLEVINVDLGDKIRSQGPTGRVIKSGTHFIVNDIENDRNMVPWKENALKLGYKATATFPLKVFDEVVGTFSIYSDQKDFFKAPEIELLNEMASDISFALEYIQKESERKLIEEHFRESEKIFSDVFQKSPVTIVLTNPEDSSILDVNETFLRDMEYSRDEVINHSLVELGLFDNLDNRQEILSILKDKGMLFGYECGFRTKSGKLITALLSVAFFKQKGKTVQLNTLIDITDRKIAEETVRKLYQGIEYSPASVVITDINGNIEYVNKKFCNVTGFSYKEVIGENPRILSSGDMTKVDYKEMWDTILSGKDWMGEFHNKKKNGELYWESASVSPIQNEKGEVTHFIGIKEDITDKKKMINDLITAKEKAEESNRLKSSFLANMSHELRTPLVGILGFAELLSLEDTDSNRLEMIDTILNSGNRLMETLNSILDISRIEADKEELKLSEVNINEIINESINLFNPVSKQKGLFLDLSLPSKDIYINSDREILLKIFNNLLSNAVKYTSQGGIYIKCKLDNSSDSIVVDVIDTGVGISIESQNIIFEPFRQASEGYARKFEGTGLGLSIAKRYVEMLNGKISLVSDLGKGSAFTVTLPYYLKSNQKESGPTKKRDLAEKEKPSLTNSTSVLLVEDDESNASVVSAYLKDYVTLQHEFDGESAINKCSKNQYDVVLMDINLKGINGIDTMSEIRHINEHYKKIPIIAITAYAMVGDKEKFLSLGFDHYLSKPFRRDELIDLLSHIFKN